MPLEALLFCLTSVKLRRDGRQRVNFEEHTKHTLPWTRYNRHILNMNMFEYRDVES